MAAWRSGTNTDIGSRLHDTRGKGQMMNAPCDCTRDPRRLFAGTGELELQVLLGIVFVVLAIAAWTIVVDVLSPWV